MGLRELQHCPSRQLTGSSWRSPHPESQLPGVQFPYWGSSRLEDGLSNLSWETRGYELCPLGSHTHSFHNSERGWKIMPAASERRSLLTGIPHGEPSRREIGSETILGPARTGFFNRRTPSMRTLSRTPRSWAIGEAYRRSLSHDCTIASSPLAELDVCLDRMAAPILPRREEPDINTLCPQSTFQELPVMGKEYASLDRSWPPVLGSGERHVLEESFLNFSRVTERFS